MEAAPSPRLPPVPGGRGHANAGVMVRILPHATPAHLRDMAGVLMDEAKQREASRA
jgi:hypothetical protein